jgi:hypothetical protein
MHRDSTPNFQTKLTKLTHFNDFINHADEEKEDLKKVKRSFTKNAEGSGTDIGNKTKYKYNRVTRKMDDDSLSEIKDDIKMLDDLVTKDKNHKYKIVSKLHQESAGSIDVLDDLKSNFRSWRYNHDTIEYVEKLTSILKKRHPETDESKLKQMAIDWCGFECENDIVEPTINKRSDYRGGVVKPHWLGERKFIKKFENFGLNKEEMHIGLDNTSSEVEFESPAKNQSYMFFENLKTIKRMTSEMLEMDQDKVNDLLNNGHNWAEDHISTAREAVSHVYDFLNNKLTNENHEMNFKENENYMFFANIENIHNQVNELIELDYQIVNNLILNGHDWAEDHISSAKEKISQVYDLLKSKIN